MHYCAIFMSFNIWTQLQKNIGRFPRVSTHTIGVSTPLYFQTFANGHIAPPRSITILLNTSIVYFTHTCFDMLSFEKHDRLECMRKRKKCLSYAISTYGPDSKIKNTRHFSRVSIQGPANWRTSASPFSNTRQLLYLIPHPLSSLFL